MTCAAVAATPDCRWAPRRAEPERHGAQTTRSLRSPLRTSRLGWLTGYQPAAVRARAHHAIGRLGEEQNAAGGGAGVASDAVVPVVSSYTPPESDHLRL